MKDNTFVVRTFVVCTFVARNLVALYFATFVVSALGNTVSAAGVDPLPGPIPATVTKILGPGTFLVAARTWLGTLQQSYVEIRDLQIPNADGPCPIERQVAGNALSFVRQKLANKEIFLTQITYSDKAATVKANVIDSSRDDLGQALIRNNLAKPANAPVGFCQ